MNSSENISTLAAALVKAQKAFTPALKQAVNPHFKSKYVDLASAIEAAQPALLENGIAVLQGAAGEISSQSITVTTRLLHSSGEWIEDCLTLPAATRGDFSAQSAGSAITYARRYSYMAILGFAPEDDDGNGASGKGVKPAQSNPKFITREQADKMRSVATAKADKSSDKAAYNKEVRKVLESFGCSSMGEILVDMHQDVIDALEGI